MKTSKTWQRRWQWSRMGFFERGGSRQGTIAWKRARPGGRFGVVGAVCLGVLLMGVVGAEESAKGKREPIPGPEEIARAEARIREVYQAELARAEAPSEKQKLAVRWIEEASATSDDPSARFALLKLAQQIGVEVGDVGLIIRAIEETGKYFELDVGAARQAALQKAAQQPRTPTLHRIFAEKCSELMEQAIKQDDFAWAMDCGRAAYTAAQQANDPLLVKAIVAQGHRVVALRAEYEKVQAALKTLTQQPDDSEAHLLVGRYLCLVREDWPKGLPHLAKGSDPDLKSAAEKDLAHPTDVRGQMDVADLWWELAQKYSGPEKEAIARRAGWWYAQALPQATGLDKTKATIRLAEVSGKPEKEKPPQPTAKKTSKTTPQDPARSKILSVPEGGTADLFKQIDPKKHRLTGDWIFRGGRLVGIPGPGGTAGLHIPVLPRGSYEIQMDFTRTGGEGMIGLLVPVGGQRCVVVLDCRPGIHGIDMVAGQRADNNPTTARGAIQTGRTYKLEIKVVPEDAEASITVHLDERPWLFYRGPAQDLQLHKEFTIRAGGGLALLTRCSVAIHSLQLRPRSGQVLLLDSPAGTKSAEKK